jgi:RNA polymerase sigma-70 factor (ECF subfamily)
VLAATVRVTRDIDLAEECVQDAYARALTAWDRGGVPARPGAWLTTAARNRALDVMRRDALFRRAMPELVVDEVATEFAVRAEIPDDRLRLI